MHLYLNLTINFEFYLALTFKDSYSFLKNSLMIYSLLHTHKGSRLGQCLSQTLGI